MGNAVVAKPSELTPTTATMLASILVDAGLPQGVFNVVHGTGVDVGAALCAHRDVGALSFTGGTTTGAAVASAVAPRFAKLSLELGGKNPLVVFSDCDFDLTVTAAVRASFLNSGQICLCASRIFVQDDGTGFYERFVQAFAERAAALTVGMPSEPTTDIGPVISAAQRDKVARYTANALQEPGVELLCGGPDDERLRGLDASAGGKGHWWAPTVLAGCATDSAVAQEEVFGPLVTMHRFETDEEAIATANGTQYGLAASVWSENLSRAHSVAAQLEAGTVWVNCWLHRQLHMPFGGLKNSGVSREGGTSSLDFYSELSTLCVKLGERTPPPMPGGGGKTRASGSGGAMFLSGARRKMHSRSSTGRWPHAPGRRMSSSAGQVSAAPTPMGAYVHARAAGGLLFLAGIGPRDAATNQVPGGPITDEDGKPRAYDVAAQTQQCIANIETVLAAHNLTLADVVDVHAFLVDMRSDFASFNAEYAKAFGALPSPPTRTTVEVRELPPGGRIAVELKVIAQARE